MHAYTGCIYSRSNFNFAFFLQFNSFRNVVGCNNDILLRVIEVESVKDQIMFPGKCAYIIQRDVSFGFLQIVNKIIFQSTIFRLNHCFTWL
jgi:hypothetical protein